VATKSKAAVDLLALHCRNQSLLATIHHDSPDMALQMRCIRNSATQTMRHRQVDKARALHFLTQQVSSMLVPGEAPAFPPAGSSNLVTAC